LYPCTWCGSGSGSGKLCISVPWTVNIGIDYTIWTSVSPKAFVCNLWIIVFSLQISKFMWTTAQEFFPWRITTQYSASLFTTKFYSKYCYQICITATVLQKRHFGGFRDGAVSQYSASLFTIKFYSKHCYTFLLQQQCCRIIASFWWISRWSRITIFCLTIYYKILFKALLYIFITAAVLQNNSVILVDFEMEPYHDETPATCDFQTFCLKVLSNEN
jgi:hypothetical protein